MMPNRGRVVAAVTDGEWLRTDVRCDTCMWSRTDDASGATRCAIHNDETLPHAFCSWWEPRRGGAVGEGC
jgi:hypothetical protein